MQRACPGPFLVLLLCLVGAVTVTLAQPLTEAERGNVKRLLEMQHRTKVIIPLSEAEFRSVIDPKKFSRDFHVVLMLHAGETREVAHVLKEMTELLKAYNDHLRSHSKEERQLLFFDRFHLPRLQGFHHATQFADKSLSPALAVGCGGVLLRFSFHACCGQVHGAFYSTTHEDRVSHRFCPSKLRSQ